MRKNEARLINDGYVFYSYEYDFDAQFYKKRMELGGNVKCKLLRERTDTKGLKMYSLWVKEINH